MLIDSIETLQHLFLPITSLFEGVSLLALKNAKNDCQFNPAWPNDTSPDAKKPGTNLELLRAEVFSRPWDHVESRLRQDFTEHLILVAESHAK